MLGIRHEHFLIVFIFSLLIGAGMAFIGMVSRTIEGVMRGNMERMDSLNTRIPGAYE